MGKYIPPFYEMNPSSVQLKGIEQNFPMHIHPEIELILIFEGKQDLIVNEKRYKMSAGNVGVIFPNVKHAFEGNNEKVAIASVILFSPNIVQELSHVFLAYIPQNPIISLSHQKFEMIRRIIDEMRMSQHQTSKELLLTGYVYLIMAQLLEELKLLKRATDINSKKPDIVIELIDYIAQNYREELTIDRVARELNLSSSQLSRIFSNQLHINFRSYLNSIRVSQAQKLLINSNISITEICYMVGYENQKTFNRAFKDVCNMTPSEYRANSINQQIHIISPCDP